MFIESEINSDEAISIGNVADYYDKPDENDLYRFHDPLPRFYNPHHSSESETGRGNMSQNSEEVNTTLEAKSSILAEVSEHQEDNEQDNEEDEEEDKKEELVIDNKLDLLLLLEESIKGKTAMLKPGYLNYLSQRLNQESLKTSLLNVELEEKKDKQIVLIKEKEAKKLQTNEFMWCGRNFKWGRSLGGHRARSKTHKSKNNLTKPNTSLANDDNSKADGSIVKISPVKRNIMNKITQTTNKWNQKRENSQITRLCDLPSAASTPLKAFHNAYNEFDNMSCSSYDF